MSVDATSARPEPGAVSLGQAVGLAQALAHGLTAEEFTAIERHLGRAPNLTELGVFSVMWSEHCSYKSSRRHLAKLPTTGPRVIQGPGENAGAVDLGDGWLAVFKIESHNHPSFIEPYQGAATGVGGILRDIFAMGARPIASMDSLKFGSLDRPRNRYLVRGVVGGIGGYGNCVGVPTVAGETMFDSAYDANILVNAFCLGIVRRNELLSAKARGVGNPVLYVGSATGRDGIHGASLLASNTFGRESEAKRPTVQVGDPFTEKLLIEACLEAARTGALVALQDMGAAGLTSSSAEMASRGGLGIELELDRVPLREPGLTPYEILLSESQERMLIVAERGREEELQAVFRKWDLNAVVVGQVTGDGRWRARFHGDIAADITVSALTDQAPVYNRPATAPSSHRPQLTPGERPAPAVALKRLLGSPNVASKRWIFRQYDWLVQGNSAVGPGSDAAALRIPGTGRGLVLKVDSNPRACALDPYWGTVATVVEAARNVACAGARPIALTNCLNYGNPERPEIMWQFVRSVEGLRDAAAALETPVVSGNVSFYNETEDRAIPPTPTIAMVGLLDALSACVTSWFKAPGDVIVLVRSAGPRLAASEYGALFGWSGGTLAPVDLAREKALIEGLVAAAERQLIRSAHDVSDGGLAVALAQACFNPEGVLGAEVGASGLRLDLPEELFGEGPSAVIMSVAVENAAALRELFSRAGLETAELGTVTESAKLRIGTWVDEDVSTLWRICEEALPKRLAQL